MPSWTRSGRTLVRIYGVVALELGLAALSTMLAPARRAAAVARRSRME